MEIEETIAKARDAITVNRVYGEAYERNGVTVIPAAAVSGGAGGGGGEDASGDSGGGVGFGLGARPVGAYVISNDNARWEPAFDVTRIIGQALLALAALLFWLGRRG
jgi:uncharacterized spore protein YtfJ